MASKQTYECFVCKANGFPGTLVYLAGKDDQEQQQSQQQQQQTAYDAGKPIKDLSFDIDNVTFSHHTASVNGIQMHYVIGGQGEPVVLLHGWPET